MTLEATPATKQSGDDLVVRARTDREAFGRLYDAHYPAIFRYCFRRLFVRAAAEDVTSDVFLGVALKMPRFAGTTEEDFRRWLFRIATNEINAYVRQTKRRRVLLEAAARSGTLPAVAGSRAEPCDAEKLDWPVLYRAILTLKPRDQAILHLRFFEKMSHEQIASVLQERPATVRVGLTRALERLRRCFKIDPVGVAVQLPPPSESLLP
jgi:RNA polymerase sigma-70 factor, ECF subfamily